MTNENIDVDPDVTYQFQVSDITMENYQMTHLIIAWLKENLAGLKDKNNNLVFGKVNTGYNENTLKTFGKKPVCDVYLNNVEYRNDFTYNIPEKVNTIVIFTMKGNNNATYEKACELHDYLMQEFISNDKFKYLSDCVSDTVVTNSRIQMQPMRKVWGIIGAFELTHDLYH